MNEDMSPKGGSASGGKRSGMVVSIIVVILLVGVYLAMQNRVAAPSNITNNTNESQNQEQAASPPANLTEVPESTGKDQTNNSTATPDYTPPETDSGGESPAPNIPVTQIAYDGTVYTPSTVNIKKADYVFFKNNSDGNFWPASASHPTHTDYPEFDPKKPVASGETFKFQFTQVGSWNFHDHLNPKVYGVVTVTE